MKNDQVIIFGYNEYAKEIVRQFHNIENPVRIYTLEEALRKEATADGYEAALFDLSDRWDDIAMAYDIESLRIFCALQDDANNVFLTISLRAAFKDVFIATLARNQENADKLRIAGADKVMPILQTTANIITEHIEKPVVTKALHALLYEKGDILIAEVLVGEQAPAIGQSLQELSARTGTDLIIMSVSDHIHAMHFAVTKEGAAHRLAAGDTVVVIGYNDAIQAFRAEIGGEA